MGLIYRKAKMVLNYLEDKPNVYKAQQVTFPAVTFDQLVNECSLSCGVNAAQTKAVIDALTDRLVHYMEIGHPVKLGIFGSFKPFFSAKTAKKIDEVNGETIRKKGIRFTPGRAFRNMLKELTVNEGSPILDMSE